MDDEAYTLLSIAKATWGPNLAQFGMKRTFVGQLNVVNLFFGIVPTSRLLSRFATGVIQGRLNARNVSNLRVHDDRRRAARRDENSESALQRRCLTSNFYEEHSSSEYTTVACSGISNNGP